jgi:hypothetical protein
MTSKEYWDQYQRKPKRGGDDTYPPVSYQGAENPFGEYSPPMPDHTSKGTEPSSSLAGERVSEDSSEHDKNILVRQNFGSHLPTTPRIGRPMPDRVAYTSSHLRTVIPYPSRSPTPPSMIDSSLLYPVGAAPGYEENTFDNEYGPDSEDEAAAQKYLRKRDKSPIEFGDHEFDIEDFEPSPATPQESVRAGRASHLPGRRQFVGASITQDGQSSMPDDDPMDLDDTTTVTEKDSFTPSQIPQSAIASTTGQESVTVGRRIRRSQGYVSRYEVLELGDSSIDEISFDERDVRLTRSQRRELRSKGK